MKNKSVHKLCKVMKLTMKLIVQCCKDFHWEPDIVLFVGHHKPKYSFEGHWPLKYEGGCGCSKV